MRCLLFFYSFFIFLTWLFYSQVWWINIILYITVEIVSNIWVFILSVKGNYSWDVLEYECVLLKSKLNDKMFNINSAIGVFSKGKSNLKFDIVHIRNINYSKLVLVLIFNIDELFLIIWIAFLEKLVRFYFGIFVTVFFRSRIGCVSLAFVSETKVYLVYSLMDYRLRSFYRGDHVFCKNGCWKRDFEF